MLDSLVIVEGESAREFQFTVEFDQPFPLRTAGDAMTPISVLQTQGSMASGAASGWILGLSAKNVELCQHAAQSRDRRRVGIIDLAVI